MVAATRARRALVRGGGARARRALARGVAVRAQRVLVRGGGGPSLSCPSPHQRWTHLDALWSVTVAHRTRLGSDDGGSQILGRPGPRWQRPELGARLAPSESAMTLELGAPGLRQ